jgi:hypothetical protein
MFVVVVVVAVVAGRPDCFLAYKYQLLTDNLGGRSIIALATTSIDGRFTVSFFDLLYCLLSGR